MILNEMNGAASVEDVLALTLDALLDAKARMRPVFGQERIAASAGRFLKMLLGNEPRKTGWMRAEAAGDPGPWRQQALLGRPQWDADAMRDVVREHVVEHLGDPTAVLVADETGFLKKGRGCQKGVFRKNRSNYQAFGRSRGGFGSKVCVAADGRGKALSFTLIPGQAHELSCAIALLDALPAAPRYVVCDRGYTSNRFREDLWSRGLRPVIPTKRNEPSLSCPQWAYRHRHLVENLGLASKSGEPLPPDTRKPPLPSSP